MSDQKLRLMCQDFLRRVAVGHGGAAYSRVNLSGRTYEGLDLLWDGPDRILAIALCWDSERLALARKDFLLFTSACQFAGLAKKFHLVLFHAPNLTSVLQDWPVGISVSPILLDDQERHEPPQTVAIKLGSLVFQDEGETAAAMQEPPNWRRFLSPSQVEARIRELAQEKVLPAGLEQETAQLLDIAHGNPAHLQDRLHQYLKRRWEASQ